MRYRPPILMSLVAMLTLLAPAMAQNARDAAVPDHSTDPLAPVEHSFDHLVLAISDLEVGIDRLAAQTGVQPVFGGEHPHAGTHNALASLGAGRYLEIVAPRPGAESDNPMLISWIGGFEEPTPILWAVATPDAAATRDLLAEMGFRTSEPQPGSRATPDGTTLTWQTFGIAEPQLAAAPFFIQWSESSTHPSATSPTGCSLTRLAVVSNDNPTMKRLLSALALEVEVIEGERPALSAELACPAGPVRLRSPE